MFPRGLKAKEFLEMMKRMRKMNSEEYLEQLLERFALNTDKEIKNL